jgi:molybdate transport system substrate-binding protein
MKRKLIFVVIAILALSLCLVACNAEENPADNNGADIDVDAPEQVELLIAAAASLENAYVNELIPLFEEQNEGIKVIGTYDSSGNLQTQIESGMEADVFMSAAVK